MAITEVNSCIEFLASKFISVRKDWLQACISWLYEENQTASLSQSDLFLQLYEQWLLSDLGEIGAPVLSEQIAHSNNQTILRNFAVQVNFALDISRSAYSQYTCLQGQEVEEHSDLDEQNPDLAAFARSEIPLNGKDLNPSFGKAQASRTLLFQLQDGGRTFEAIEYQPISLFQQVLAPGLKILLKGPLLCRDGLLLLRGENVQMLGGNAEQLEEQMSQLQLLKSVLKLPAGTVKLEGIGGVDATAGERPASVHRSDELLSGQDGVSDDDWVFDVNDSDRDFVDCDASGREGGLSVQHASSRDCSKQLAYDVPKLNPLARDEGPNRCVASEKCVPALQPSLEVSSAEEVLLTDEPSFVDLVNAGMSSSTEVSASAIDERKSQHFRRAGDVSEAGVGRLLLLNEVANSLGLHEEVWTQATFVTLLSQLKYDCEYSLEALITDSSCIFVHVVLSNQVLEKLIGFSASDMRRAVKKGADPHAKGLLKKAVSKSELDLQRYAWTMKLSRSHGSVLEVLVMHATKKT